MNAEQEKSLNKPVDDKKESLVQHDTKEQTTTEKTDKTEAIKVQDTSHHESTGINWKGVFSVIGSVLLQLVSIP